MEAGGPKAEVKAGQLLQGSGGTPCFPNAAAKPCRATPYVSRAPMDQLTQDWPGPPFLIMSWHARGVHSHTPSQCLTYTPSPPSALSLDDRDRELQRCWTLLAHLLRFLPVLFGLMHIEAQSGKLQTCLRAFACHPCNQAAAPWLLRQTWRESYRKNGSTSAPSEPVTLRSH